MARTNFAAGSPAPGGTAAALTAVIIWALVPVGTRFFVLRIDPLMFNVVRFLASERLGLFLYLIPIVSIGAGARLLGESLNVGILSGGALTIAGIWVASRPASCSAESACPDEA